MHYYLRHARVGLIFALRVTVLHSRHLYSLAFSVSPAGIPKAFRIRDLFLINSPTPLVFSAGSCALASSS
jgi:hypothetical protein